MRAVILFLLFIFPVFSQQDSGFLETRENQLVLHLKGTPYEIGYQHGSLLKEQIQKNIAQFIDKPPSGAEGRSQEFLSHLPKLKPFIAPELIEEMRGVAAGSGIAFDKIFILNLFPEMFHCSGITVTDRATADEELYHVRVLDYSIGKTIQDTAVLMIVEPEGKIPFMNVSYAGFVGSVTGMNREQIAIGEIGGHGYGHWEGVPMAFLMRTILEKAHTLSEAQAILSDTARTCEYYYVISDGKTKESVGVYATASQIHFLKPGETHAILAPPGLPLNYAQNGDNDKFFLSNCLIENTPHQTLLFEKNQELVALARTQLPDCLLMTGFAHPERYPPLIDRVKSAYGSIDAQTLIEIIKEPVARPSNLHNAIFHPASLTAWISHAGPNNEPACDQPYGRFSLEQLLAEKPGRVLEKSENALND